MVSKKKTYNYEFWEKRPKVQVADFIGSGRIKINISKIKNKEKRDLCKSFLNIKYNDICKVAEKFNRKTMLDYLNLEVDKVFCEENGVNTDNNVNEYFENVVNIYRLEQAIDDFIKQKLIDKPNVSKSTRMWYNRSKSILLEHFNDINVKDITYDNVQDFKTTDKITKYTINMTIKFGKMLFKELSTRQKVNSNIFNVKEIQIIKEDEDNYKMLTDKDFKILLNSEEVSLLKNKEKNNFLNQEIRNLSKFGGYTGLRISAALNIRIKDIYEENGVFWLKVRKDKTKNGVREIPLHKNLYNFIKNKKSEKVLNEFLFFQTKGRSNLTKTINEFIDIKLNDDRKRFNSFRKSFITKLDNNFPTNINYRLYLSGHTIPGVDNKHYIKQRNKIILIKMINSITY